MGGGDVLTGTDWDPANATVMKVIEVRTVQSHSELGR